MNIFDNYNTMIGKDNYTDNYELNIINRENFDDDDESSDEEDIYNVENRDDEIKTDDNIKKVKKPKKEKPKKEKPKKEKPIKEKSEKEKESDIGYRNKNVAIRSDTYRKAYYTIVYKLL